MKDKLIKIIQDCDKNRHGVCSHESFSPSSSIEEIADHILKFIQRVSETK